MDTNPLNPPAKAGLYFAKSQRATKWDLIAAVFGEPPFLQVMTWRPGSDKATMQPNEMGQWQVEAFGPEIVKPNVGEEAPPAEPVTITHEVKMTARSSDLMALLTLAGNQQARIVGRPNPEHPAA